MVITAKAKIRVEGNLPLKLSRGAYKYPINELNVGQSFLVDGVEYSRNEHQKVSSAVCNSAKRTAPKKAFSVRKEGEKIAVWRIK